MQSHLHQNQNQCVEQPNRMPNGPNHPGPGPEEIPMVDVSPEDSRYTDVKVRFNWEENYNRSMQADVISEAELVLRQR